MSSRTINKVIILVCCTYNCVAAVPILIERKQGSGTYGTVNVVYSTLSPTESYPFLPALESSMRRADYDDYDFVTGVMSFVPGQTNASVNVSIKANNYSQPDSVVFLRLNYVTLIQAQQLRPGTCGHISYINRKITKEMFQQLNRWLVERNL